MLIVYIGAGLWLASLAGIVGLVVKAAFRKQEPLPDPAFRKDPALAEDTRWAGIESEWHAFVDSFGVREVGR